MTSGRFTRRWHLGKVSIALGVAIGASAVLLAATRVLGVPSRPPPASLQEASIDAAAKVAQEAAAAPLQVDNAAEPVVLPAAGTPEARLVAVYRLIAAGRMDAALRAAESLVRDLPTFKLAQLVYADLLSVRRGVPAAFGSAAERPGVDEELAQLRSEAGLRLAALRERPPAGAVPAQFVMLPASQRHAIAVDVSRARLYLFANGDEGLRLVGDYYVSVGKQGADKLVEGDQKTPLGIYQTTESIDRKLLEDRFGSGALPLNYPNPWDRASGRTGSGILLHGVPSDTYARVPRATDGCVVLANDDLLRLAATIDPRATPVVIAQKLEWVSPDQARAKGERFMGQWQAWLQARLNDDREAVRRFYQLAADGTEGAASDAAKTARRQRRPFAMAGYDDLSVLAWSDRRPVMVVSFRERGADGERARRLKRQYWALEQGNWKIISES